jgi:anti-sigma-28 factor FlgM
MRIGQRNGLVGPPFETPVSARRGGAPPRIVRRGRKRVAVPGDAGEVARLRALVGPVDDVRTELVRRLRAAVESGEYRPDPVAVATSMLRDLLAELVS